MNSFNLIQKLVQQGSLDAMKHNFPVGFSIMTSGKILLKFTTTTVFAFDTFDEVDLFVSEYLLENFGYD